MAEIVTGVMLPPDFTTFWKRASQQRFKPKIAAVGKALLFPAAVAALGRNGHNLSSEVWWTPSHPFKSSLTGQSARQIADAYQQAAPRGSGRNRSASSTPCSSSPSTRSSADGEQGDAKALVAAIAATKLDTIVGHDRIGRRKSAALCTEEHRAKTPLVGGQWRLLEGSKYNIVYY